MHPEVAALNDALDIWDPDQLDLQAEHVRTEADVTPEVRRWLTATFSLYVWLSGAKRLVDKLPRNGLRIPYLYAMFPDCKVIQVIRDGRAVVASMVQLIMDDPNRRSLPFGGFAKPPGWRELRELSPAEQFAHTWLRLVRSARTTGAQLLSSAYTEVSYEEFCREPRAVLSRLYDWSGLPAYPRLNEVVPTTFEARNKKWLSTLSVKDRDRVAEIAAPLLEELGYGRSRS